MATAQAGDITTLGLVGLSTTAVDPPNGMLLRFTWPPIPFESRVYETMDYQKLARRLGPERSAQMLSAFEGKRVSARANWEDCALAMACGGGQWWERGDQNLEYTSMAAKLLGISPKDAHSISALHTGFMCGDKAAEPEAAKLMAALKAEAVKERPTQWARLMGTVSALLVAVSALGARLFST